MFKYATIILSAISAILLQYSISQNNKLDNLKAQINEKTATIEVIQSKIDEYSKAEEKTNKIINELRKKANEDKCYNAPLPDYIIERLQS